MRQELNACIVRLENLHYPEPSSSLPNLSQPRARSPEGKSADGQSDGGDELHAGFGVDGGAAGRSRDERRSRRGGRDDAADLASDRREGGRSRRADGGSKECFRRAAGGSAGNGSCRKTGSGGNARASACDGREIFNAVGDRDANGRTGLATKVETSLDLVRRGAGRLKAGGYASEEVLVSTEAGKIGRTAAGGRRS